MRSGCAGFSTGFDPWLPAALCCAAEVPAVAGDTGGGGGWKEMGGCIASGVSKRL